MRVAKSHASLLVLLAALLSGCAFAASPIFGVYTEVKAPLTATGDHEASRTGTAECTSILGIVAQGDCSIQAAMENGDISNVHHVDYEATNILGFYSKFVTIVYGE